MINNLTTITPFIFLQKLMYKSERTILVLPIVGLDLGVISNGNSAVLWFGARLIKPSFSS
jgi:hypothetical protein